MKEHWATELRNRSRTAFDAQAATYDEGMQGAHARRLYPLVVGEVVRAVADAACPRILDAGCGTGALAALVRAAVPGCALTGVDVSANMAAKARERLGVGDQAARASAGRADGVCPAPYAGEGAALPSGQAAARAVRSGDGCPHPAIATAPGTVRILQADVERLPFPDASFSVAYCNDSFHHYPDPERAVFQLWRVLAAGGTLIIGDIWQPAPARALMNAWMPYSHEGDVRMYGEQELRRLLGTWFGSVTWRRVSITACLAVARKNS